MIIPYRTPPLFFENCDRLRLFFFCIFFFLFIGWFRYDLKHILDMFETNFKGRLFPKTIESVIMIITRQNRVTEARSIWSLILKIVWNWNFEINTKFVFGLNRAKQLGLERCKKNPKRVWSPPADPHPPPAMIMITVGSMGFF